MVYREKKVTFTYGDGNTGVRVWEMKCETCLYFSDEKCRRHAPTWDAENLHPVWPMVNTFNFCGDHELLGPQPQP